MNKKSFIWILILFLFVFLFGCTNENNENKENEQIKELVIATNGVTSYDFLCAEKADNSIILALKTLINKINANTGLNVKAYRDSFNSEEGRCEVLIGLTNRSESIQTYESLKENSYKIEIVNNCVVIIGSSDVYTTLALVEFENKVIKNQSLCNNEVFKITSKECVLKEYDHPLNVQDILEMGYVPYVTLEKFITVRAQEDIKVAQGACADKDYIYFILRDSGDTKSILFKYDKNGNFIKQSEEIYLGHGNDLAYDSKNDYLICAHGVKEANTYSIIDKDTLTITKTFTVSKGGGGSITYNEKLDLYSTSKGGETISFYGGNFEFIKTVDRVVNEYTAQGIGSDENYIYCPMSGSSDNVLVTYDWEGNFITNVIVPTSAESETMFESEGIYYLNFYVPGTGAVLYKMQFSIKYE